MQLRTCKAEAKEEERWTGFGQTKAVGGSQPVLLSPPLGAARPKSKNAVSCASVAPNPPTFPSQALARSNRPIASSSTAHTPQKRSPNSCVCSKSSQTHCANLLTFYTIKSGSYFQSVWLFIVALWAGSSRPQPKDNLSPPRDELTRRGLIPDKTETYCQQDGDLLIPPARGARSTSPRCILDRRWAGPLAPKVKSPAQSQRPFHRGTCTVDCPLLREASLPITAFTAAALSLSIPLDNIATSCSADAKSPNRLLHLLR